MEASDKEPPDVWDDVGTATDTQIRINQSITDILAQHAAAIMKLQERFDALHAAGVKELAEQQSASPNPAPAPPQDAVDQLFEERQA